MDAWINDFHTILTMVIGTGLIGSVVQSLLLWRQCGENKQENQALRRDLAQQKEWYEERLEAVRNEALLRAERDEERIKALEARVDGVGKDIEIHSKRIAKRDDENQSLARKVAQMHVDLTQKINDMGVKLIEKINDVISK